MANFPKQEDIAIIGVGVIGPNSKNANELWKIILSGEDCITEIPANRWLIKDYFNSDPNAEDQVYSKHGSFLPDIPFDAVEFGIPPANVEVTDTTQLLALIATKEALQDACQGEFANVDLQNASVILGVTSAQELLISMGARIQKPIWKKALQQIGLNEDQIEKVCNHISDHYVKWNENTFPGLLGNVVSGRIANRFNFGGTNCITDAACASSFSALSMAIDELTLHRSDLVITGGADTLNDIFMYMCFSKTKALSFKGKCSPFSDDADGTLLGEAICLFAIKRLSDAEANNDHIYAVIKGIGTSSDGRSKSIYAPLASGQAKALKRAYQIANYTPDTVQLVEAHGTGTKAGDAEEFKGLKEVFESSSDKKQWCALGSIKSQIGHTKASAGAVGLFKLVMALRHKVLPPTINISQPNQSLAFEKSPFYLNTRARPWIKPSDSPPRRASINSFGFGGTNFHVTLEEYNNPTHLHGRLRDFDAELVVLSGDSKHNIIEQLQDLENASLSLFDLARKTQLQFDVKRPCKLAFILKRNESLKEKMEQIKNNSADINAAHHIYYSENKSNPNLVFVFPDEGVKLYMGEQIAMHFDVARRVWDELAELKFDDGMTLDQLVFPPAAFSEEDKILNDKKLNEAKWFYPVLAAHAFSQFTLLKALGITTDKVIGHQFGNLIAKAALGSMDLVSLIKLSWEYGQAKMRSTISPELEDIASRGFSEQFVKLENSILLQFGNAKKIPTVDTLILVSDPNKAELESLWDCLAQLTIQGVPLEFKVLWRDYAEEIMPLPHKYSANTVYITGSNYRKPSQSSEHHATPEMPISMEKRTKKVKSIKTDLMAWATREEKHLEEIYHQFEEKILKDQEKWMAKLSSKLQEINEATKKEINLRRIDTENSMAFSSVEKPFTLPEISPLVNIGMSVAPTATPIMRTEITKPVPPPVMKTVPELHSIPSAQSDITKSFIQIIAEKTGFDPSIIKPEMGFEADLGIDSIKRVEILAALRKAIPNLPVAEPSAMAALNTIQEVIDFLSPSSSAPPVKSVPSTPLKPANIDDQEVKTSASEPTLNSQHFIQIIAEKTGFDPSIIKPEMALEGDLGIDSIKRVEILAALRKAIPNLPLAEPNEMAALVTIQEIIDFLNSQKKK